MQWGEGLRVKAVSDRDTEHLGAGSYGIEQVGRNNSKGRAHKEFIVMEENEDCELLGGSQGEEQADSDTIGRFDFHVFGGDATNQINASGVQNWFLPSKPRIGRIDG